MALAADYRKHRAAIKKFGDEKAFETINPVDFASLSYQRHDAQRFLQAKTPPTDNHYKQALIKLRKRLILRSKYRIAFQ